MTAEARILVHVTCRGLNRRRRASRCLGRHPPSSAAHPLHAASSHHNDTLTRKLGPTWVARLSTRPHPTTPPLLPPPPPQQQPPPPPLYSSSQMAEIHVCNVRVCLLLSLLGNTSCSDLLLLPSFQLWIDIFLKLIGVTRGAQHLGLKDCLGGSPASGREKYDEPPSCDETLPRSKCLNGPGSPHERVAGHERLKAGPASIASRQYDSYSISETQCPYSERKVGGWGGISLASRAPARDLSLAGIAATHQRLDHASFPWGDKPRPPLP